MTALHRRNPGGVILGPECDPQYGRVPDLERSGFIKSTMFVLGPEPVPTASAIPVNDGRGLRCSIPPIDHEPTRPSRRRERQVWQ